MDSNKRFNELALFAGAGGGILGGHLLNWRTVCAVEIEPFCAAILAKRQEDGYLPPFPIWDDVSTFDGKPWRGKIDVISGGFPCQDVSVAGRGTGIEGERSGLWREFARIIGEVRPKYAFVENSPALRTRGLTRVLSDLAEIGYDAVWTIMGAYEVGAPHIRKRIWILAIDSRRSDILPHSDLRGSGRREQLPEGFEEEGRVSDSSGERREEISVQSGELSEALEETSEWKPCRTDCNVSDSSDKGNVRRNGEHGANEEAGSTGCNNGGGTQEDDCGEWWGVEPGIRRVADGVPYRVDRLKALGNAQVPLVAAAAFKVLKNILDKKYKELK